MNVIKQLLTHVPEEQQNCYESYLHTHLKIMMTGINKAKVQDITPIIMRKNKCVSSCYKKNFTNTSVNDQGIYDTVEEIRSCKERCGNEKKAVKKYLSDINYYSFLKFNGCSKNCEGDQHSTKYNQCIWGCLNKLDRRYKKYWVEKRQEVQNKFKTSN